MSTGRSGSALSFTLTVTPLPSATVYVPCSKDTSTAGTSSSLMETVVSWVVPALTPAGGAPKLSFTDSSSSSSASSAAVNVKLLEVSVGPNVRLVAESE